MSEFTDRESRILKGKEILKATKIDGQTVSQIERQEKFECDQEVAEVKDDGD